MVNESVEGQHEGVKDSFKGKGFLHSGIAKEKGIINKLQVR